MNLSQYNQFNSYDVKKIQLNFKNQELLLSKNENLVVLASNPCNQSSIEVIRINVVRLSKFMRALAMAE